MQENRTMTEPKLISDRELKRLAAQHWPASAEAYVLLELCEARSRGLDAFAFRSPAGLYSVKPLQKPVAGAPRR